MRYRTSDETPWASPEGRERIRRMVDARRRELVADDRPSAGAHSAYCSGCGAAVDDWSAGCARCGDRHRRRARTGRYPGGWPAFAARREQLGAEAGRVGGYA